MECRIRSTKKNLNENKLDQKTLINNRIVWIVLKSLDSIDYFLNIFMSFFLDNIIRINIFCIFF